MLLFVVIREALDMFFIRDGERRCRWVELR